MPLVPGEKPDVAQRSIEILIGRLVTDEAFRDAFRTEPAATHAAFVDAGYPLNAIELAAMRATAADLWEHVAERIDPRLQKVSFARITANEQEEL